MTSMQPTIAVAALCVLVMAASQGARSDDDAAVRSQKIANQFCSYCHGAEESAAGVNFDSLFRPNSFASEYRTWQTIEAQLEQRQMPPADADQPTPSQRTQLINWIRRRIQSAAKNHEGDPGHVVIRRLTSAEYGYAIQDLTGIEIEVERGFVSDAVGGAGFTNTGIVQFTQDSTLERYLEAARHVADHAVIGTGPLAFFRDPGATGFELSAIDRILKIYRAHGFRTAAGEGGEAFGADLYPKAPESVPAP